MTHFVMHNVELLRYCYILLLGLHC